ncbi:hypothetical protein LPJ72_001372 [Coemansia sp. Benny D160-2]|nr:hypothetical protein LPJ72_001372 [Coemansia sp. Benny D160-2]
MAHIDTTLIPRSRFPRAPPTGFSSIGGRLANFNYIHQNHQPASSSLSVCSNLSQDATAIVPNKDKSVIFVFCHRFGTTLSYIESTLKHLSLKDSTQNRWGYGTIAGDRSIQPFDRIRVNGVAVDKDVYERYSAECLQRIGPEKEQFRMLCEDERIDAIVTRVALRVFGEEKVTAVVVSIPCMCDSPIANPSASRNSVAETSNVGTAGETEKDGESSSREAVVVESLVVDEFGPKHIICGFEPLPTYWDNMPERWRKSLAYLMRRPTHVISSLQPRLVRMQLHGLAKIFGVTIELAQPLSAFPTCKDIQLGIYGQEQHQYAALALALCQSWAFKHGILRSRTQTHGAGQYTAAMALSPLRPSSKLVPPSPYQMHIQSMLRDTPQWMLRGLTSASSPGQFYTSPSPPNSCANWHYSWAETPDEFATTGSWFSEICQRTPSNPRILLIHLPESFIKAVQHRDEETGQWIASDYRAMLQSLYLPLRKTEWTCCVFAANILYESNVMEYSVPPELSQYVLRDFWTQLSGLRVDQIYIAPSLVSALQLITSRCATHAHRQSERSTLMASYADTMSPGIGTRSAIFETPGTPRQSQLVQPSPSSSNLLASATTRPARVFSRTVALKSTASFENLREGRRKLSFGFGTGSVGNESTISLPSRTPTKTAPLPPLPLDAAMPSPAPSSTTLTANPSSIDILVTGSKSFVQSTLSVAQR